MDHSKMYTADMGSSCRELSVRGLGLVRLLGEQYSCNAAVWQQNCLTDPGLHNSLLRCTVSIIDGYN